MKRVLGVGIVGCGVMSTRDLLPNLVLPEVADRLRLVAVCDVLEERARATAEQFKAPHVYTNHTALAEDAEVDIVAVGTPVPHHFAAGMSAISAGKHIYMQKTMTLSVAEADQLIEAADGADVKIAARSDCHGRGCHGLLRAVRRGRRARPPRSQ